MKTEIIKFLELRVQQLLEADAAFSNDREEIDNMIQGSADKRTEVLNDVAKSYSHNKLHNRFMGTT
jgi:hypothetical protein